MDTSTGQLHVGAEEIKKALASGATITELTPKEYEAMARLEAEVRVARLEEMRARPHRSRGSRKRARKHRV